MITTYRVSCYTSCCGRTYRDFMDKEQAWKSYEGFVKEGGYKAVFLEELTESSKILDSYSAEDWIGSGHEEVKEG